MMEQVEWRSGSSAAATIGLNGFAEGAGVAVVARASPGW